MALLRSRLFAPLAAALACFGCGDSAVDDTTSSSQASSSSGVTSGTTLCAPGDVASCYAGPAGTEGVGVCHAGTEHCLPDGSGYSECMGEQAPSAENCATADDEDCDGAAPACSGAFLGEQTFQGTGAGEVYGLAFDAAGGLYATGIFSGTIDIGTGPLTSGGDTDLFTARFGIDTNPVDMIGIGGLGHEEGLSLDAMPGTGFAITGRATQDVDFATLVLGEAPYSTFVGLFSPSMAIRWARGFSGGSTTYVREVAVNGSGRVAVVGYFQGTTIDLGAGPVTPAGLDAYVAIYDEQLGTLIWSRILSTPGTDQAENISIDEVGNVFVSLYHSDPLTLDGISASPGRSVIKLDANGIATFIVANVGAVSVVADEDGGVVYGSQTGVFGLDAQGTQKWSYSGSSGQLARDGFGNIVTVAGPATLVKLDPSGNLLFETPLDMGTVRDLAVANDGRIAITGRKDVMQLLSTVQWFEP